MDTSTNLVLGIRVELDNLRKQDKQLKDNKDKFSLVAGRGQWNYTKKQEQE